MIVTNKNVAPKSKRNELLKKDDGLPLGDKPSLNKAKIGFEIFEGRNYSNSIYQNHYTEELRLKIPTCNSDILYQHLNRLTPPTNSDSTRDFVYESGQAISTYLPTLTRNYLLDLKSGLINPEYVLISGLPSDRTPPPTPTDGKWSQEKTNFVAEGSLLGISQMIGNPYGFNQEKDGKIINQIAAVKGKEYSNSSAGSMINLDFHGEVAFEKELKPDFVVLFCIRPDKENIAETVLIDVRNIIPYLGKKHFEILKKPRFTTRIPLSFTDEGAKMQWSQPAPIIKDGIIPELVVDTELTKGLDEEAQISLDFFGEILKKENIKRRIKLQPGDCLIIPNRTSVHGRTPFIPVFNGFDRWLIRCYVRQSLWEGRNRRVNDFGIFI